jgi:hypothetical protein
MKEHGNSLVPHRYAENKQLGLWVHKQRRNYIVYKEKCKDNPSPFVHCETSLSPERIKKLDDVHFVWDVLEAQWLERYEELKKYRRDHGDTLVPKQYSVYPLLGRWVEKQRGDYKKYIAKKKLEEDETLQQTLDKSEVEKINKSYTGMTEERIRLLEAEDFIWNARDHAWQLKYDEMCEWIALNGHGAIHTTKSCTLAAWARHQQQMYQKYLKGEKIRLPKETIEDRIEKLIRVGFVF